VKLKEHIIRNEYKDFKSVIPKNKGCLFLDRQPLTV